MANADESEPGTFKDRIVMERDPFALVEAMTIAGFVAGAERGYIYLRGEYPVARRRLAAAIDQAYRRGYLGADVMGHGFAFDLELRIGAGAYICGEETALFNSLEGFRGEPRSKPPFPVEVGLFGKPTLVNNVETLLNVLPIVLDGGPAYAATGAGTSTGTKLYCVSGRVERPGLYELPFGVTLRQLLDLAGGVAGGRPLQAVLMGGAAGAFLTPEELDSPSPSKVCGKPAPPSDRVSSSCSTTRSTWPRCSPASPPSSATRAAASACRAGSAPNVRSRPSNGWPRPEAIAIRDLALLADLDAVMTDASICGLGQTAASAIRSALVKLQPYGERTDERDTGRATPPPASR